MDTYEVLFLKNNEYQLIDIPLDIKQTPYHISEYCDKLNIYTLAIFNKKTGSMFYDSCFMLTEIVEKHDMAYKSIKEIASKC